MSDAAGCIDVGQAGDGPDQQEVGDAQQGQRESVKAQALIEKAERLLEGAGTEDRDDLVDSIEAVRDALAEGDAQALEEATAGLSDLIFYLQS